MDSMGRALFRCFPPPILVHIDAVSVAAPKQPLIAVTLMLVAVEDGGGPAVG
jgi:hypothetical protein